MKLTLLGEPALDAAKMAMLFAIRRDWAPFPLTQSWHPSTQKMLFEVAQELQVEALAILGRSQGEA